MSEESGDASQDNFIASAADMLRKSCDHIADKLRSTRDQNLAKGIVINHFSGNALRFYSMKVLSRVFLIENNNLKLLRYKKARKLF